MNARFDDAFQLEMLPRRRLSRRAGRVQPAMGSGAGRCLWGFDLSERNLRVLQAAPAVRAALPPLIGTGNVSSGRLIVEYARLGCQSVQLHTFFQLPLSEYPATDGSRPQRALHALSSTRAMVLSPVCWTWRGMDSWSGGLGS